MLCLCYNVICDVMLCYAMLYCAMICYVVPGPFLHVLSAWPPSCVAMLGFILARLPGLPHTLSPPAPHPLIHQALSSAPDGSPAPCVLLPSCLPPPVSSLLLLGSPPRCSPLSLAPSSLSSSLSPQRLGFRTPGDTPSTCLDCFQSQLHQSLEHL